MKVGGRELRLGRLQKFLLFVAFFVLAALSGLWFIGVFGGNLREVTPDKVYRSAQLTGSTLEHALRTDHIGTVLNLRGAEKSDAWYQDETGICRKLGVDHVDVALSATRPPPPEEMAKVIHTFDTARYPVLLHCMGGSDRSGLVAAIYRNVYEHEPLDQAQADELTLRFGHFRWGRAVAMDNFLDLYRKTSGGLSLRDWILHRYPTIFGKGKKQ